LSGRDDHNAASSSRNADHSPESDFNPVAMLVIGWI
jgi:hypothetical protein